MSPLIIKTSLALMPPMAPLSKEPGTRGRGSGADSATCSYHDKISEDERPVGGFSSTSESMSSEVSVPSMV